MSVRAVLEPEAANCRVNVVRQYAMTVVESVTVRVALAVEPYEC